MEIYFDLNNNYTALIHGHSHPEITKVAIDQVKTGTDFLSKQSRIVICQTLMR